MESKNKSYERVILSGGYADRASDKGEGFCIEILDNLNEPVKILECTFALPEEAWASSVAKDQQFFGQIMPGKQIQFEVADPARFSEQIQQADVVYFRGGDTDRLYKALSQIPSWKQVLKNKTIVGASAGAYVLSELYIQYTESGPELRQGYGIVPAKTVTHYRSSFRHNDPNECELYWNEVDKILSSVREDLRCVQLMEGEFITITNSNNEHEKFACT